MHYSNSKIGVRNLKVQLLPAKMIILFIYENRRIYRFVKFDFVRNFPELCQNFARTLPESCIIHITTQNDCITDLLVTCLLVLPRVRKSIFKMMLIFSRRSLIISMICLLKSIISLLHRISDPPTLRKVSLICKRWWLPCPVF